MFAYKTRCVVMPSLMAAHWVGQNSGLFFLCGPKYAKLSLCGSTVVCNAIFLLTMSCCVPEILVIKSRSCPESGRNFDILVLPNFTEKGSPF